MNTSRLPRLVAALSLATAGLAGCTDTTVPASAAQVRARIGSLTPALVNRLSLAERGALLSAAPVGRIIRLPLPLPGWNPAQVRSPSVTVATADRPGPHLVRWFTGAPLLGGGDGVVTSGSTVTPPQLPPTGRAPRDAAAWLDDEIFADDNLVDGEFPIPPDVFCTAGDTACAEKLAQVRYGIIATPVGDDGLDLEVVAGADRAVVASISLAPGEASAHLDLGGLAPLADALINGRDQLASVEASGTIDVVVAPDLAADSFKATVSIGEPVHVAVRPSDGSDALTIDLGRADHAFSVGGAAGPHAIVTSAAAFGAVEASLPSSDGTRVSQIDAPSFEYRATTRDSETKVTGLSFGRSAADLTIDEEVDTGALVVDLVPVGGAQLTVRLAGDVLQVLDGELRLGPPSGRTVPVDQCVDATRFAPVECDDLERTAM